MTTRELERRVVGQVRKSIVDRLTDHRHTPSGLRPEPAGEKEEYIASVARDLEWLLNTLRHPDIEFDAFDELRTSVYAYGMPDITSLNRDSPDAKRHLLRSVEQAIERFEPRLRDVRVDLVESEGEQFRRELRFYVQGTLMMDPAPRRLVFNGLLDYVSGTYELGDREPRGA